MSDAGPGDDTARLPDTVGARLRAAREAQGLSLAEIGARTRVPLRHLEAIEAASYADLPSSTYAIGFVRAYARVVGADEVELARDVRAEIAATPRVTPQYQPYEIADPSRVPSRGLVIVAAGLALAVLVLAILYFATGLFRGTGGASAPEAATPPVAVGVPAAAPVARPAAPTGGQVRLTANDEVWLRVYDADNKTLYLGTMKPGESFDVPQDAKAPKINVGRADKLAVTLNGAAVPALGTGERAIKDVAVDGASIAARASGATPVVAPSAVPSPTPSATRATTTRRPAATGARETTPRPRASASPDAPENLLPPAFRNGA